MKFSMITEQCSRVLESSGTLSKIDCDAIPPIPNKHEDVEIDLEATEGYADLQGLNSGNLMKFSQQSQIEELFINGDTLDRKVNLDVLPTLEDHDNGGMNFHLNLKRKGKGRITWCYSETSKKVYIKRDEVINIETAYTPQPVQSKLQIRAMIVFVKEVSKPVLRCQNHISADHAVEENIRRSVLRCENGNVKYFGSESGKNISDRLSVLVPLSNGVTPNKGNITKQTIALKFSCQNSCIGRRETSLIFYLETLNGEILSQRVIDIRICSCPKRDLSIDEKYVECTKKRSISASDDPNIEKKIRKTVLNEKNDDSEEDDEYSDEGSVHKYFNHIIPISGGGYRVVLEFPDKEAALHSIECSLNKISAQLVSNSKSYEKYSAYYQKMKKLLDKLKQA